MIPRDPTSDVDREIEDHIERRTAALVARGMSETEARSEARARFGDRGRVRAECVRIQRRRRRRSEFRTLVASCLEDGLSALRGFRHRPAFTALAVGTLALGMGATAGVFSVVHAVLLRPLPFPQPEGLHRVVTADRPTGVPVAPAAVTVWSEASPLWTDVAAFSPVRTALTGPDVPRILDGWRASASLFGALGVDFARGRSFGPTDDRPGAAPVVVLSHRVWQRDLAGADIRGRSVALDGVDHEIVGVLPPSFDLERATPDFVVPLALPPEQWTNPTPWLGVLIRLGPDAPPAAVADELRRRAETAGLDAGDGPSPRLATRPLADVLTEGLGSPLWLLLGAVGALLLIGCVNVANLLLARGTRRADELALRAALGAGRGRIVRHLLAESLLLGVLGALAALPLAALVAQGIRVLAPAGIPRIQEAGMDVATLGVTLLLGVVTALVAGVLPAVRAGRTDVHGVLKRGSGRLAGTPGGEGLRSALVVAEIALCLLLLGGAGLLIRSAHALSQVDRGFQEQVLTARLAVPASRYPALDDALRALDDVRAAAAGVPGVRSVEYTSRVPLAGNSFGLPVAPAFAPDDTEPVGQPRMRIATPGYFEAMGLRLVDGRLPGPTDDVEGNVAVVVNHPLARDLARELGDDASVVGSSIVARGGDFTDGSGAYRQWTVIGVVEGVRDDGLRAEAPAELYFLPRAVPPAPWNWIGREVLLTVALEGPGVDGAALRSAVSSVAPELALHDVETMAQRLAASLAVERLVRLVMTVLAVLGVMLAAGGIVGVVASFVARRIPEVGLRMALGASGARVTGEVVRRLLTPVVLGVATGLLVLRLAAPILGELLFDVGPADPLTLLGTTGVVGAVAVLAAWIPARRAARVDPIRSLTRD